MEIFELLFNKYILNNVKCNYEFFGIISSVNCEKYSKAEALLTTSKIFKKTQCLRIRARAIFKKTQCLRIRARVKGKGGKVT